MIFSKKKKPIVNRNEVETTNNPNALTSDKNNDGIPDYLQRDDIASIMSSNKDLNQWESDVKEEIEEFIMGLRGYEFNVDANTFKPQSPPIMNEIGIKKTKTHIQSVVNKHSINTGLKEDEVHEICGIHIKAYIRWLTYNYKKCNISFSDLRTIVSEVDNFIFIVLSRSINDAQRGHVTKRTSLHGQVGGNSPVI